MFMNNSFIYRSFAFKTVKDRLPIILTRLIDHLVRDKDYIAQNFGEVW